MISTSLHFFFFFFLRKCKEVDIIEEYNTRIKETMVYESCDGPI